MPLPLHSRRWGLALAAIAAALVACNEVIAPDQAPDVSMPFIAAFTDYPDVAQVVVTVSGPRIDPDLVFNFPVVNDTARGTVTLPVGSGRLVVAQAFDGTGTEILRGEQTITVLAGTNPAVALVLLPLTGSVPVTAVIGEFTLTLSAAAPTLRAGSTVALSAEVRDETGTLIATPVRYAVSRPPAARVSDDGTFLALDTGAVTVTATAFGRAASTALSITAGSVVDLLTVTPDSLIADGSVTALLGLSDNVGVDSIRLRTTSPTGVVGPTCASLTPLRGTRTLGEFSCVLSFGAGAELGRWPVASVEVHAGANVAILDSIALRHRGAAAAVRIVP